jgi:2-polyprenyl-3-methyl-5-hydroxy-6-metoxy-1,4-benzoquinol methylase
VETERDRIGEGSGFLLIPVEHRPLIKDANIMTQIIPPMTDDFETSRDAFVNRLIQSTSGVFDIFTIYIGDRLGFYEALSRNSSLTSTELANLTSTQPRYVREWLEQQTVAGILAVDDASAPPSMRRFYLPAGHLEVLVHRDSPNYLAPLSQLVVGVVSPLARLLDAFRQGGGVPYHAYGADMREGQAAINRVTFLQDLGTDWLPSIPDVHARLAALPAARVADIGCGAGWSSIGMAQAYPDIQVDGFDLDEPSVEMARMNAREAGLDGRANFYVHDAGDPALEGQYDLVTAFECIHDMSDPVNVLNCMRKLAGETGTVLVIDERVGETFTAEGNDIEWMMYGWSVLHCLPVGLSDHPSVGTGTVMRPETLRRYALEAGFREIEALPIENFFFRIYRLFV